MMFPDEDRAQSLDVDTAASPRRNATAASCGSVTISPSTPPVVTSFRLTMEHVAGFLQKKHPLSCLVTLCQWFRACQSHSVRLLK